jgi:hypothetical protein
MDITFFYLFSVEASFRIDWSEEIFVVDTELQVSNLETEKDDKKQGNLGR